jgi:caa(3)-type oxidase subunit IV
MSESAEHHTNYVKIWAILVVLLVISVLGPMLEIQAVTLITAFGIAVVKAYLVAKNFMHINLEKRFVTYFVVTSLVFMLLFFAGTAPDVMKAYGTGWEKVADQWNPPVTASAGHGDAHH